MEAANTIYADCHVPVYIMNNVIQKKKNTKNKIISPPQLRSMREGEGEGKNLKYDVLVSL